MPMSTCLRNLCIITALGLALSAPVYAEAPVYDVDSLAQQGDDLGNQDQDVMPPPPGEGTFVPIQRESRDNTQAESSFATPPMPATQQSSAGMSTDARLKQVEQQLNKLQAKDLSARTESLQTQVQNLRGQVEQLSHQLQQLQEQQKSLALDVDRRLNERAKAASSGNSLDNTDTTGLTASPQVMKSARKPTSKIATKSSTKTDSELTGTRPLVKETADATASATSDQPNVAEEQQIYQTAYNLIKSKKYTEAVDTLQKMLKKYPSGQFASNAHYWLGELYGLLGKNDQALNEFSLVVKTYPDSPRISDAQLKIGLIYATQSKWTDAKSTFKKVINRYPGTASARLASEQLKQIKQTGH